MASHLQIHLPESPDDHDWSAFVAGELLEVYNPGTKVIRSSALVTTDVADAVTKKHSQNTDQYLDFGGAAQVAVAAVRALVDKLDVSVVTAGKILRSNGTAFGAADLTAGIVVVTPAGNLASTDVQAGLVELQGDIDTLNTSFSGHVTALVGAHAATAISVTPSGNLTSIEVQAGLVELQLDVDGRALASLTLTAGNGLTGGGDLTANRSFAVAPHADGSISVSGAGVQVGILATDAQHGARGGGTQHASATISVAGFLPAADKQKLDYITVISLVDLNALVPNTRTISSGDGLTGGGDLSANRTLTVSPHADGSISVSGAGVQVGILATDAQHGTRGGGTIHAAATTSVAGFMSGADKTKLDYITVTAPINLDTGVVLTTRTLTAGNGLSGGGDLSANRSFAVSPHADGSISVSGAGVQVGILATDAQHGTRGGGTVHAAFVGDTGAGGIAGFVPAPAAGDAATLKFLKASGVWATLNRVLPYSFAAETSPYLQIAGVGAAFVTIAEVLFEGSTFVGAPTAIALIVGANGLGAGQGFLWRIQDLTNTLTIATSSADQTSSGPLLHALGAVSNVPTGQARWAIQVEDTNGTGTPTAHPVQPRLMAASLRF